jgi:hypothetical protein
MPLLIFQKNLQRYEFDHDASGYPDKFKDPFREDELTASFREVVNQFMGSGVVVVAAAGNDAKETHPSARFPAAYDNVIGVGAMPNDSLDQSTGKHKAASYSNLCDKPPFSQDAKVSGYVTLGGEAGAEQGIRGVYIHDLPSHNGSTPPLTYDQIQYVHNDTGWAWWAGTSFAAPIISGLLATAWKSNWQGTGNPHSFLSRLAGQNRSNAEERTILVKQLNP